MCEDQGQDRPEPGAHDAGPHAETAAEPRAGDVPRREPFRAAARGLVAAMAMSGLREVTTGLGWLERTPPDKIVKEQAPLLMAPLAREHQQVAVQVAHWAYGAAAGFAYGLLPGRLRRSRLAGPAYGMATLAVYELGIAPALGVQVAQRRTVMSRLMLVTDHLLYGAVVAGRGAARRRR